MLYRYVYINFKLSISKKNSRYAKVFSNIFFRTIIKYPQKAKVTAT